MSYLEENGIKAVGFDVFGTLIEGENNSSKFFYVLVKKYGLDISKLNFITTKYSDSPKDFFEEVFGKSLINIDKNDLSYWNTLFQKDFDNYKLFNYSENLIEEVRKEVGQVFLISNLACLYIPVIEKLGLNNYFNFILYSCELGIKKTPSNPKIFDKAFTKLQIGNNLIKKNEILFTGDNKINDLESSNKAGFKSILIDDFKKIILSRK